MQSFPSVRTFDLPFVCMNFACVRVRVRVRVGVGVGACGCVCGCVCVGGCGGALLLCKGSRTLQILRGGEMAEKWQRDGT